MFRQETLETLASSWFGGSRTVGSSTDIFCFTGLAAAVGSSSDEILDFSDVVNNLEWKCD